MKQCLPAPKRLRQAGSAKQWAVVSGQWSAKRKQKSEDRGQRSEKTKSNSRW